MEIELPDETAERVLAEARLAIDSL